MKILLLSQMIMGCGTRFVDHPGPWFIKLKDGRIIEHVAIDMTLDTEAHDPVVHFTAAKLGEDKRYGVNIADVFSTAESCKNGVPQ